VERSAESREQRAESVEQRAESGERSERFPPALCLFFRDASAWRYALCALYSFHSSQLNGKCRPADLFFLGCTCEPPHSRVGRRLAAARLEEVSPFGLALRSLYPLLFTLYLSLCRPSGLLSDLFTLYSSPFTSPRVALRAMWCSGWRRPGLKPGVRGGGALRASIEFLLHLPPPLSRGRGGRGGESVDTAGAEW